MDIAFRLDATTKIGSGHFVRCMTLANGLRKEGHKTKFFYRNLPDALIKKLICNGHDFVCIKSKNEEHSTSSRPHSDWLEVSRKADAQAFKNANQGKKWDWIIIDHYALDIEWEKDVLEETNKIMVIDDLADRPHHCHLLLDQNFTDAPNNRYDLLTPQYCDILLGPKYVLLMPEYARLHKTISARKKVKKILVSFGGADKHNMTLKTIEALLKVDHQKYEIDIIAPLMSDKVEKIRNTISSFSNFTMHHNLSSLATILAQTDLAIGAIGTTSWERLCLGVPTIAVITSENQKHVAESLHKANLIRLIGHLHEMSYQKISSILDNLLKENALNIWSKHCLSICDGHGVSRVINRLAGS